MWERFRAACTDTSAPGPPAVDKASTLPLLIHGDAAFPGQGIVAETLNLSRLRTYDVGGTVHIIANNQIGFTATPRQSYSTSYASGLARGFKIPIFHVNADDPEAAIEVARMTAAYRARFKRDTLIDLVGYRRHGHNEGDEPSFTQPAMYKIIAALPTVREKWAHTLASRGVVSDAQAAEMVATQQTALEQALETVQRNAQPTMYKIIASHPTVREIWARTLEARGLIDADQAAALVKKYMLFVYTVPLPR